MDAKMRGKKGQISMFIIIAVILVVGVALFFVFREEGFSFLREIDVRGYIDGCVKDATIEAVSIMLPQGGYISPTNYKLYEGNKVQYLCYNQNYYYSCINQEPRYIEHLEKEIKSYVEPKVEECFYSLKKELEKRDYKVDIGKMNLFVELNPGVVEININRKLDMSKQEESLQYKKFNSRVSSPLYDLAVIAVEIASQEAKFCNFEYVGYSLLYPRFIIEKDQVGSEETASDIYKIKEKASGKELLIAIRSCAMPGGL